MIFVVVKNRFIPPFFAASLALVAVGCSYFSEPGSTDAWDPEVEHRVLGDVGSQPLEKVEEYEYENVVGLVDDPEVTRLVLVEGSMVAVTENGVYGVDRTDGNESWRYQVFDAEVAVAFDSSLEHVVVSYRPSSDSSHEVTEVTLNVETGEVEASVVFPFSHDFDVLNDTRMSGARVLVEEDPVEVVAQTRGDESTEPEERWRMGMEEFCNDRGLDENDVSVTAGGAGVYISLACEGENVARVVSVESGGSIDFIETFPLNESGIPVEVFDYSERRLYEGESNDPVHRAIRGDFNSDYAFIDARWGEVLAPEVWGIDGVEEALGTTPAIDGGEAYSVVIGNWSSIEIQSAVKVADFLIDQGAVDFSDFPENLLLEDEGGGYRAPLNSREVSGDASYFDILDFLENSLIQKN